MSVNIGNEFVSFNAATLLNQGNKLCLLGTSLPSITGLTLSSVNSVYTGQAEQIRQQGWPTIINSNVESIVDGNVLTLSGAGVGQILLGWNNITNNGVGHHSSMYIRNKGSGANTSWSNWFEVLDSGNFMKYVANYSGEGAVGVWGIDITGNANSADFLRPITITGTYNRATYNLAQNSRNIVIWSEAFGDSTLKYTANGAESAYTDTGDIVFYLVPNETSDDLRLNMYIDGTFEGHFKGNLNGTAEKASNASLSTGTNTLAYYDNALGHFNYTADIKYLKETLASAESGIQTVKGRINGLVINSENTYSSATDIISHQSGVLSYGDAGPQIRFHVGSTQATILFNDHADTAGSFPSFQFLGQTVSTTNDVITKTPINIAIKSGGMVATSYMTVGAQKINNLYTLTVHGTSGFYNNINMLDSVIHFSYNKQYIEWYDSVADRITNQTHGTGLMWNGIGTYLVDQDVVLNISNQGGINITTSTAIDLLHNDNVIPSAATSGVGTSTNPIYLSGGMLLATTYALSADINGGAANRIAYYNSATSIDDAAHFINNSQIAINETTQQSETLYVNGTTRFTNDITLGTTTGGDRIIYYSGTQADSIMFRFLDNVADDGGNGLLMGGGGLVVVGAGESATYTNISSLTGISAATEALYLLADAEINIEAGASTWSNRTGIQITAAGHVVPIKTEAVNTNAQYLGSTTSRWGKLYVGTADSYGSNTQPIYWNAGVPTALTFTTNRIYYGVSTTSFTATGHYVSETKLAINYTNEPTQAFYVNGTSYFGDTTTFNGSLIPNGQSINLGRGGQNAARFNTLYIGDADTYGAVDQPIYWNNGVPTAITSTKGSGTQPIFLNVGTLTASTSTVGNKYVPTYLNAGVITPATIVQKVNFQFNENNMSVKITHDSDTDAFTANSIVLSIVVTAGEDKLSSKIEWTSATGYIALNVATAVSGTVEGYILVANGIEVANADVTLTQSNLNI